MANHADHTLPRSNTTRVMHLLLLLVVVNQLASSQFMRRPLPGDPPAFIYAQHQYVGLAGLALMAAFWVWMLVRRGETRLVRLLPWLSPSALRDVAADAGAQYRRLASLRAPDDSDGALASAVHGLGLLVVSAMTLSGGIYYVTIGSPLAHDALSIHKLFANLTYAYIIAHAGLAVLHHLLGSDIFSRMFWTRHRQPASTRAQASR